MTTVERQGVVFDQGDTPSVDNLVSTNGAIEPAKVQRLRELERWLRHNFDLTLDDTLHKASAYGTTDIAIMGDVLVRAIAGQSTPGTLGDQSAIGFYALGKLSRILAALQDGQMPSIDSWQDLRVYAMMGEKIASTGRWL